jgi:hypothetical protein
VISGINNVIVSVKFDSPCEVFTDPIFNGTAQNEFTTFTTIGVSTASIVQSAKTKDEVQDAKDTKCSHISLYINKHTMYKNKYTDKGRVQK